MMCAHTPFWPCGNTNPPRIHHIWALLLYTHPDKWFISLLKKPYITVLFPIFIGLAYNIGIRNEWLWIIMNLSTAGTWKHDSRSNYIYLLWRSIHHIEQTYQQNKPKIWSFFNMTWSKHPPYLDNDAGNDIKLAYPFQEVHRYTVHYL